MASTVRYGLIGFGAWGKFHAQSIAKTEGAELVAIAARSEATRGQAAELYPQATVFADYRDLLEKAELDAVDIVLPSYLHHEVASAVLTSGRHLLLEKPMTLSVADCDDLIRVANEKKLVFCVGHELRLSSLWSRVKELIDEGYIGTPNYALVELSRKPYRPGAEGWRFDIDRVGSWVLEEPIHFFDLARWYLSGVGEPTEVYASGSSRQEGHPELLDNFSAIIKTSGNAYAVVSQTLSAFEHHQTAKVCGTNGALWASWSGALDRTLHPNFSLRGFSGGEVETIPIEKITGEVFELEDQIGVMTRAIQNGSPLHCTADDGRWSVAMCLAAERSIRTGLPCKMEEIFAS